MEVIEGNARLLSESDLGDSKRFVRVKAIPLLDVHDHPKKGNIDEPLLKLIADNTNERAGRGDYPTVLIGHTFDEDGDEEKQPPAVGVAANFRVGDFRGNACLFGDLFIRREDYDKAMTFPHRSVERVRSDKDANWNYLEAVSLLRRAPERHLGVLVKNRSDLPAGATREQYAIALPEGAAMERPAVERARANLRRMVSRYAKDRSADPGVMVAFWVPEEVASSLAVKGGEDPSEHHVTLCYLGRKSAVGDKIDKVREACEKAASSSGPVSASLGGLGRFSASGSSDGKDVIYASVDSTGIGKVREAVVSALREAGVSWKENHGFTPHVTLAYIDPEADSPVKRVEPKEVSFDRIVLAVGGEKEEFPMGGKERYSNRLTAIPESAKRDSPRPKIEGDETLRKRIGRGSPARVPAPKVAPLPAPLPSPAAGPVLPPCPECGGPCVPGKNGDCVCPECKKSFPMPDPEKYSASGLQMTPGSAGQKPVSDPQPAISAMPQQTRTQQYGYGSTVKYASKIREAARRFVRSRYAEDKWKGYGAKATPRMYLADPQRLPADIEPYIIPRNLQAIRQPGDYKKFVDAFRRSAEGDPRSRLANVEEAKALAQAGAGAMGGHDAGGDAVREAFGDELARIYHAANSILSARTSVTNHTVGALHFLSDWIEAGRPGDEGGLRNLIASFAEKRHPNGTNVYPSTLGSKVPGLLRVFSAASRGEPITPEMIAKSNEILAAGHGKTPDFFRAQEGEQDPVVTDKHMGALWKLGKLARPGTPEWDALGEYVRGDRAKLTAFLKAQDAPMSKPWMYAATQALGHKAASELGVTPKQWQEGTWSSIAVAKKLLNNVDRERLPEVISKVAAESAWDPPKTIGSHSHEFGGRAVQGGVRAIKEGVGGRAGAAGIDPGKPDPAHLSSALSRIPAVPNSKLSEGIRAKGGGYAEFGQALRPAKYRSSLDQEKPGKNVIGQDRPQLSLSQVAAAKMAGVSGHRRYHGPKVNLAAFGLSRREKARRAAKNLRRKVARYRSDADRERYLLGSNTLLKGAGKAVGFAAGAVAKPQMHADAAAIKPAAAKAVAPIKPAADAGSGFRQKMGREMGRGSVVNRAIATGLAGAYDAVPGAIGSFAGGVASGWKAGGKATGRGYDPQPQPQLDPPQAVRTPADDTGYWPRRDPAPYPNADPEDRLDPTAGGVSWREHPDFEQVRRGLAGLVPSRKFDPSLSVRILNQDEIADQVDQILDHTLDPRSADPMAKRIARMVQGHHDYIGASLVMRPGSDAPGGQADPAGPAGPDPMDDPEPPGPAGGPPPAPPADEPPPAAVRAGSPPPVPPPAKPKPDIPRAGDIFVHGMRDGEPFSDLDPRRAAAAEQAREAARAENTKRAVAEHQARVESLAAGQFAGQANPDLAAFASANKAALLADLDQAGPAWDQVRAIADGRPGTKASGPRETVEPFEFRGPTPAPAAGGGQPPPALLRQVAFGSGVQNSVAFPGEREAAMFDLAGAQRRAMMAANKGDTARVKAIRENARRAEASLIGEFGGDRAALYEAAKKYKADVMAGAKAHLGTSDSIYDHYQAPAFAAAQPDPGAAEPEPAAAGQPAAEVLPAIKPGSPAPPPATATLTASQQTAADAKKFYENLGPAFADAGMIMAAEKGGFTIRRPDAIAALKAKGDDAHYRENPDGSYTVLGGRLSTGEWVGEQPPAAGPAQPPASPAGPAAATTKATPPPPEPPGPPPAAPAPVAPKPPVTSPPAAAAPPAGEALPALKPGTPTPPPPQPASPSPRPVGSSTMQPRTMEQTVAAVANAAKNWRRMPGSARHATNPEVAGMIDEYLATGRITPNPDASSFSEPIAEAAAQEIIKRVMPNSDIVDFQEAMAAIRSRSSGPDTAAPVQPASPAPANPAGDLPAAIRDDATVTREVTTPSGVSMTAEMPARDAERFDAGDPVALKHYADQAEEKAKQNPGRAETPLLNPGKKTPDLPEGAAVISVKMPDGSTQDRVFGDRAHGHFYELPGIIAKAASPYLDDQQRAYFKRVEDGVVSKLRSLPGFAGLSRDQVIRAAGKYKMVADAAFARGETVAPRERRLDVEDLEVSDDLYRSDPEIAEQAAQAVASATGGKPAAAKRKNAEASARASVGRRETASAVRAASGAPASPGGVDRDEIMESPIAAYIAAVSAMNSAAPSGVSERDLVQDGKVVGLMPDKMNDFWRSMASRADHKPWTITPLNQSLIARPNNAVLMFEPREVRKQFAHATAGISLVWRATHDVEGPDGSKLVEKGQVYPVSKAAAVNWYSARNANADYQNVRFLDAPSADVARTIGGISDFLADKKGKMSKNDRAAFMGELARSGVSIDRLRSALESHGSKMPIG